MLSMSQICFLYCNAFVVTIQALFLTFSKFYIRFYIFIIFSDFRLKNTFQIDGRYIPIAAKVPVFEHFPPLSPYFYCHKDIPGLFSLIRTGYQSQSFLTTCAIYPCFKQ